MTKFGGLGLKETMDLDFLLRQAHKSEENVFIDEGDWMYFGKRGILTQRWFLERDLLLTMIDISVADFSVVVFFLSCPWVTYDAQGRRMFAGQ